MPNNEHAPPKRSLAELMAEQRAIHGDQLPMAPGWDDMPAVGLEIVPSAELQK